MLALSLLIGCESSQSSDSWSFLLVNVGISLLPCYPREYLSLPLHYGWVATGLVVDVGGVLRLGIVLSIAHLDVLHPLRSEVVQTHHHPFNLVASFFLLLGLSRGGGGWPLLKLNRLSVREFTYILIVGHLELLEFLHAHSLSLDEEGEVAHLVHKSVSLLH